MKRILAVLALVLSTAIAHAQVDRATLTGTVKDESGGALSTATVTVTNAATKVVTRARTNNEGTYLVVNLIPGQYLIEGVEASGFQTKTDAVILQVGDRGRLDVTLGVGARRGRYRRGRAAAAEHRPGGAGDGGRPERDRQAAAGHPQAGTTCWRWWRASRAGPL